VEELLRCPFCGGVNLSMEDGSRDERFIYSRVVHCYGCGTMGPDCGDYNPDIWIREQSAIAAWNRRTQNISEKECWGQPEEQEV